MKINSTFSVIVRIILWLLMLPGGAVISIIKDIDNPCFLSPLFHFISACIGIIIIVMTFRAAANSGRELSKGRVGHIPRLETNRLVTSGIYGCMRHPMFFGLILLPPGLAFLLGSPTFILYIAPLEMLFIVFMVIVFEERELRHKFADSYKDYARKVPAISFNRYCLKKLFAKKK